MIEAAERNGTYIPRFCYHPRMEPVGMCRMCVVEIDTGRGPALQPACMIPVAPDMKVDTESEVTKKAQDGVLEFLLINHPLDCPVCDKGGECPLQDQTLSYGPGESRFVEEKRHFEKPIMISDLVALDRERCILCDRCTRFADEVAGDTLIHFQDRGNQTQVNTFPDHPFASYFSGNTVQICPVGALTATPYRFKARPWDLDQVESTCTTCSVGCRTLVQSSRNEILRYQGVDVDPVNWGWLCDKGRFGFGSVNSDDRLGAPLARQGDALARGAVGRGARPPRPPPSRPRRPTRSRCSAAPGSPTRAPTPGPSWPRASSAPTTSTPSSATGCPPRSCSACPRATIDEVCAPGGTVLLLAPDLKEELPVLFLRLRHAVVRDGVTVVELATQRTRSPTSPPPRSLHRPGAAGDVVRALLAGSATAGGGRRRARRDRGGGRAARRRPGHRRARPRQRRRVRRRRRRPPRRRSTPPIPRCGSCSALRRGNVHGALDMGLAPGLLPGRVTLDDGRRLVQRRAAGRRCPSEPGLDATGILTAAADGKIDVLVLLGADPLADFPDADLATRGVAGAGTVIAVDRFLTASAQQADVVLAASGPAEADGTTTNLEGRVSPVARKITPPGTARDDWMIAAELARLLGTDLGLESAGADPRGDRRGGPEPRRAHRRPARHRRRARRAPRRPGRRAGRVGGVGRPSPTPASTEAAGEAAVAAAAADTSEEQQAAEAEATEAQADAEPPRSRRRRAGAGRRPAGRRCSRFRAPSIAATRRPSTPTRCAWSRSRKLYDLGTDAQHSPGPGRRSPSDTVLRLHPHDFDRLGVDRRRAWSPPPRRRARCRSRSQPDDRVGRGAAAVAAPPARRRRSARSSTPPRRVTEVRVVKP